MGNAYKVLGQSDPSAANLTELYAVPSATEAIVSTITVCNRSPTPTDFRISVEIANAGTANPQFIAYDTPIAGNEMIVLNKLGLALAATDTLNVYATLATLSFNAFGVEIT